MGTNTIRRCDAPPPASWDPPVLVFRPDRLPPLPRIREPELAELALRHKSALANSVNIDPALREAADLQSNRRLEWEGDSLFTWLVSVELGRQFPKATAGDLSTLRQRIVSNRTLSHLSWTYGFGQVLDHNPNLPPKVLAVTHQKIIADTFEAYIGAAAQLPLLPAKMTALLDYVRELLDPQCVVGLAEAADDLRARRLGPRISNSASAPSNKSAAPSTHRQSSAASSDIDWEERQYGGRWEVSVRLAGRPIVTAGATKRYEAQQQAVNLIFTRFANDPRLLSTLFEAFIPESRNPLLSDFTSD